MYACIKRILDISVLIVFCPIWIPVMAVLALAVKLSSKGTVLFKQKRIGKKCKTFTIYKFRSMYTDAPRDTPTHLLEDPDSFITPVGRFLRRSSLDELPQIFNMIKGDITLVGPRPALWNQDDLIAEREKYGANDITPGITGLAQISGRDELPIAVKAWYDGEYAARMSFLSDIKIIIRTIMVVFSSSGVVEGGTGTLKGKGDTK